MVSTSFFRLGIVAIATLAISPPAHASAPIASPDLVLGEKDGTLAVEAEHFFQQTEASVREWHLTNSQLTPSVTPDGDPNHVGGASGGAYLEILPDTRRTHDDELIRETNFSPVAGRMALLHYKVNISTPGRYYVWVRAYSTGSEDNGLHVGIDGTWPDSGQRLQWCQGKNTWRWESKQRTEKQHCGEAHKIYLDIDEAGEHTIHFSMREDGFEFDKWMLTTDRDMKRPVGVGPASSPVAGTVPEPYPYVEPTMAFPKQWGPAPKIQTKDIRELPGGYGEGSSTLAAWIQANMDKDAAKAPQMAVGELIMDAKMFFDGEKKNYYLDADKWLAVNPDTHKDGRAARTFPYPTGTYNVTLRAVGENDGQSTFQVTVDEEKIGDFKCPLSTDTFEEGPKYHKQWKSVKITEGAIIGVQSVIGSKDGDEFSRARWAAVAFEPADQETRSRAQPLLAKQEKEDGPRNSAKNKMREDSPTKAVSSLPLIQPRKPHGDGKVAVSGEQKMWHNVTFTLNGPYAHEQDNAPNPFTDYAMNVSFTHSDGTSYLIPGYFAADGDAKNTGAESGTHWRAHFAPDRMGTWTYEISFKSGELSALDGGGDSLKPFDGKSGSFEIAATDKKGRDLRAHGRLQYVGKRYLQFAGSKQYFLKVGADAPETLLAYADFDNTTSRKKKFAPVKTWAPHLQDWQDGDPTWKDGKGKALIGAVNYLAMKGCNAFSFLTYNAGGDGDNVWPFIERDDKLHYDCSKLDQWGTVFEHGTQNGMYLHFKMQETENDDHFSKRPTFVPTSLDGGNLGSQRKLYCRELIARFGHNLALNWNLGEENTQTNAQQLAMSDYIASLDAYGHNLVIHTYPGQQNKIYRALLGDKSKLTGASLQNSSLKTTHAQTVKWVKESTDAGKPWIVAFDESGSAAHAQCPDLGYKGFDGHDRQGKMVYTQHAVRKQTLWGQLMGGGAGCEYYFGYQFAENDIVCEDWRSRDQSWDYCRIAIGFFHDNAIPFWDMDCMDELIGNPKHGISKYCLAKKNEIYLVYLPEGGTTEIDLSQADGEFMVTWFNPRDGGDLQVGSAASINAGDRVEIGMPPTDTSEDWLAVLRRKAD